MIDAHIHLDWYKREEQNIILADLDKYGIEGLVAVASDLDSSLQVLELGKRNHKVFPAIGWHPEQELINQVELNQLMELIKSRQDNIIAIGEVGLPYYLKQENAQLNVVAYQSILKEFIQVAAQLELPIVLHAVYEDADTVIEMLDDYQIVKAHFHWFKGSRQTMDKMIERGYVISVTPDCLYEEEIQSIISYYPLELMMVETDGPWQFKGPFQNQMTHPKMIEHSIVKISEIKQRDREEVQSIVTNVAKEFFSI